jgi:low affinity Fe/Cu permease
LAEGLANHFLTAVIVFLFLCVLFIHNQQLTEIRAST